MAGTEIKTGSDDLKMLETSELEELYDEFLNLDNFGECGLDSNLTDSSGDEDSTTKSELEGRYNEYKNNNNILRSEESAINFHLDMLNRNLDFNIDAINENFLLDKNGKVQQRRDTDSLDLMDGPAIRPTSLFSKNKENEVDVELKDVDERRSSPGDAFLTGPHWGPESLGLWHSGPSSLGLGHTSNNNQDDGSVISFTSSLSSGAQCNGALGSMSASRRTYSQQQLGAKVEMVYNLLSMLGTNDREDMSKTLLAMSSSPESCHAMRQSGCLPLLIQLIHSPELDPNVRARAAEALRNLVHAQSDEKRRRREMRVLKLLQQIREYCEILKTGFLIGEEEEHPGPAIAALMKFSFDEEHRQAMCSLGGLHAIAELIQLDHETHGSASEDELCITLRRYAGMALTNLTFGDGNNKSLLCSLRRFMEALVAQLTSPSEDLRQVTASVFRNLSWRADAESKTALREVGAVTVLMGAAMEGKKESTLKSILSAIWNLSAHCSMNKVDVCAVPGALAFLVKMLRYKATSNTLAIIENAGGILRNVSSHIAVREDYRQVLRDNNCFEVLLEQLKSPSLTIVSNACGSLWNLSARCGEDQRRLWEMGATSMLRSLVQSKHKMISMGSSGALKNLLAANPGGNIMSHIDSTARGLGLQALPTLFARKQRALEQELDINLSETCENIEPALQDKLRSRSEENRGLPKRSDSRESVTSTHSDSVFERVRHVTKANALEASGATLHGSLNECQPGGKKYDKLVKRYKTSMIPTPAMKKLSQEKKNEKRKEEDQQQQQQQQQLQGQNGEAEVGGSGLGAVREADEVEPRGRRRTERRGIPVLKSRAHTAKPDSHSPSPLKYGPSSLPCCSANNFSQKFEEETIDQPVDYSWKYSERDTEANKPLNKTPLDRVYAETDLDQPTNFSLRYGEESSDEDGKGRYLRGGEDTTRTYCTEGTPYEGTPFNFSSATSLSDLRVDGADDIPKDLEKPMEDSPLEPSSRDVKHYQNCEPAGRSKKSSVGDMDKRSSRDYESGISTPERPVQYCEEGTPGDCFSRVSSLSSLSGGKGSPDKKQPEKKVIPEKVVTFVDETPLMFSRSSSMNSLSSFEQVHQPDDRSSVVSEFSRLNSGAVSPSELPDSPTQTVPPSPRRQQPLAPRLQQQVPTAKPSVFEDEITNYKQESTPVEFSRATSLSSLTIDSSVKPEFSLKPNSSTSSVASNESEGKADVMKDQIVPERLQDRLELSVVSEGEESMLADCISIGMQDAARARTRPSPSKQVPKPQNPLTTQWKQPTPRPRSSSIPIKNSTRLPHKYNSPLEPEEGEEGEEAEDVTTTYHTEGTPLISHAGSHTDLVAPGPQLDDCFDDGSSFTEDILAECIQSAMPKAKLPKELPDNSMGLTLNKRLAATGKSIVPSLLPVDKGSSGGGCSSGQAGAFSPCKDFTLPAHDETTMFVTENSPCNFSIVSSLSDLTVDSSANQSRLGPSNESGHGLSPILASNSQGASPSSISLIGFDNGKDADDSRRSVESRRVQEDAWEQKTQRNAHDVSFASVASSADTGQTTGDLITARSRNPSISSLSGESFDSCEPTPLEQALLEQCIHSAMPHKNKTQPADFSGAKNGSGTSVVDGITATDEEKEGRVMVSSKEEAMVASGGGHTWSEEFTSPTSIGSPSASGSERVEGLRVVSDGDSSRKLVPNFKIGSEISEGKFLQADASKICRELRKYQEVEKLDYSCSSFLDANEISTFEVSTEMGELFESQRKLRSLQIRNEPVSLPSLNMKVDLMDALDLEGSMISVASITSEIAEPPRAPITAVAPVDADKEDTLMGSDTEMFDDENSTRSQENLPLDTETDSIESTPKKNVKKMTPKEKRQSLQDRYRTYTVRDLEDKMAAELEQSVPKKKTTPKQRRMNDRERFRTRVLGKDESTQILERKEVSAEREVAWAEEEDEDDSVTLVGKNKTESKSKSDSQLQDRYRTRIIESERTVISQELLDNATLVARSLRTAAGEHDSDLSIVSVSDTEADASLRTCPIDTATYTAHEGMRPPVQHVVGHTYNTEPKREEEEEDVNGYDDEENQDEEYERRGPRITKPGERRIEDSEEDSAKTVRGRRKKLYSSPYKKPLEKLVSSTPSSPKHAQRETERKPIALTTAKSMPNVPKGTGMPTLCREGTFTKEEAPKPALKSQDLKTTRSIPVLAKKVDTGRSIQYSGTVRNKSAPALNQSGKSSGSVRPVSSYIARSSTIAADFSHKRHNSAGASTIARTAGGSIALKRQSSAGPGVAMKNSSSNQSIKSNTSAKSGPSSNTVSKTKSNPSADSDKTSLAKGKPKTPKKEVTSKIASLWKKVEESKKRDEKNPVKDKRVWITGKAEKDDGTEPDDGKEPILEREEIVELSSGRIIRSATLQGFEEGGKSSGSSEVIGATKREVKNVVSAIVPPYNYNPPAEHRVTASPVAPVKPPLEHYHKTSMKVTTV